MAARGRGRYPGYITTSTLRRLCGNLPTSTLDNWVSAGLVRPSLRASSGKRIERWWSVTDVVTVRAIRGLRDAGCPLRLLKQARRFLRDEWPASITGKLLYWDGSDVFRIGTQDDLLTSIGRQPGQTTFQLFALDLDISVAEITVEAIPIARSRRKNDEFPTVSAAGGAS